MLEKLINALLGRDNKPATKKPAAKKTSTKKPAAKKTSTKKPAAKKKVVTKKKK
jgi:hypothetical protein